MTEVQVKETYFEPFAEFGAGLSESPGRVDGRCWERKHRAE